MEQRNEPTTAEIVAFLERLQTAIGSNRHSELWHYEQIISNARSRLEQLERENAELTARAEKAEAERDAAITEIKKSYAFSTREDGEPIYDFALCLICAKKDKPECDCTSSVGSEFEWRGLRGKGNA